MINYDEIAAYNIRQEILKQIVERQNETLIKANAQLAAKVSELEKKVQDLSSQLAPK